MTSECGATRSPDVGKDGLDVQGVGDLCRHGGLHDDVLIQKNFRGAERRLTSCMSSTDVRNRLPRCC